MVASNTTEAGIVYDDSAGPQDAPPASFPAKIARLLLERWRALGHLRGTGWQFLPCELIENIGDALREHCAAPRDRMGGRGRFCRMGGG